MPDVDQVKREPCPLPAPERHGRARAAVQWVKVVWCGMQKMRSLGLAAEMAFWLFFSLLPLAAVAGLVVARLAIAHADVTGSVLSAAPPAVRAMVSDQLGRVANWNGGAVGPVAAGVFVWLASSGLHAVFDALDVQVGVDRPWWKKRLLAIASCVGLSAGFAALAVLATGAEIAAHFAKAHLPQWLDTAVHSGFVTVGRIVVGALVAFGLMCALYAVGTPRQEDRRLTVAPGAALAVVLEAASGYGYGLYVAKVGTGGAYLAGLGIVAVTLTFLYLFSIAILAGAELNQDISDRRASLGKHKRRTDEPASPMRGNRRAVA